MREIRKIKSQIIEKFIMSILFSFLLNTTGFNTEYNVSFENNSYLFTPVKGGSEVFSLIRENDEWHCAQNINEALKSEALASLEQYLLAQH